MTDKRLLAIVNASAVAILTLCMFLPGEYSGRITAAVIFLPLTVITMLLVKKRGMLSLYRRQILFLMIVIGVVYLLLYYLSGLYFGFMKSLYGLRMEIIMLFVLPTLVIIVSSEIIRAIMVAQEDRLSYVLSFIYCAIAQVVIYYDITEVNSFSGFMDFLGLALFPAFMSGALYHYLSKRYGAAPNIAYRLITTLYYYLLPVMPAMADALFAIANLIVPIIIYVFIDALYGKKRRYALAKKSKLAIPLTVACIAIMLSVVVLISNQFRFGALVIATDSMTGEINKGDIVIFDQKNDQTYEVGQVIVFDSGDNKIVHRIIKVEKINGVMRFYTKGDFNEDPDMGFITAPQIVGSVKAKLPYLGYPTLWMRKLFIPS